MKKQPALGYFKVMCVAAAVFLCILLVSPPASALDEGEVNTTFSSEIVLDRTNTASISIGVVFKNVGEIPTILTNYDLYIGEVLPENIGGIHGEDELETELLESRGSVIRVLFGNSLLREGETYSFTVSYEVESFLHQSGGAYDVEIPLFRSSESASTETISITYPRLYGGINYATSEFEHSSSDDSYTILFQNPRDVGTLFVSLGSQRRYSFTFERALENTTEGYIQKQVLIPPDTQGQELLITSISDFPSSATLSEEGNYVLVYDVPPQQTAWIRIQGIIVEKVPAQGTYVLPAEQTLRLLDTDSEYWHIDDSGIVSKVLSATEDLSEEDIVEWMYDYTIDELVLSEGFRDLHGDEYRKGAEVAIKTYKNASVEDYADVFVALCRLVDIPARIVSGYVFPYAVGEGNVGMFHVWPQYWSDEVGWVSVDPAYEAYTEIPQRDHTGLQRVIISTMHDDSVYEFYSGSTEEIMPTSQTQAPSMEITTSIDVNTEISSGSTTSGSITILNEGNVIVSDIHILPLVVNGLVVEVEEAPERRVILPGEEIEVSFTVKPPDWYVSGEREIGFEVSGTSETGTDRVEVKQTVQVEPLWWVIPVSWLITIIAFIIFVGGLWSGAKVKTWITSKVRR